MRDDARRGKGENKKNTCSSGSEDAGKTQIIRRGERIRWLRASDELDLQSSDSENRVVVDVSVVVTH